MKLQEGPEATSPTGTENVRSGLFDGHSRRSFLVHLGVAGIAAATRSLALGGDQAAVAQSHTTAPSEGSNSRMAFPPYLREHFDYCAFTRFDCPEPPISIIYQSNGFIALQEKGFGSQRVVIPVAGSFNPTNESDRFSALTIDAPVFIDSSNRAFSMAESPAKRSMSYFADRTVYRAAFDGGPEVRLTVYPVYGRAAAAMKILIVSSEGPIRVVVSPREGGFRAMSSGESSTLTYGSTRWTYRLLLAGSLAGTLDGHNFQWTLTTGQTAALTVSLGATEGEAEATLHEMRASHDLFDSHTRSLWNEYLASVPLVAPSDSIQFRVGTTGEHEAITPEDLVRSELWHWRGLLNTSCQVGYLPASPMMIADWNTFMGMWSNDGVAETISLAATSRRDIARAAILNWFRYSVNAKGDGTSAWTIFPSGRNTFAATGPERDTQGVPMQASLVGEYVRLTGDVDILNEKVGGPAGDRTVWQALTAYQKNLRRVRDPNGDHLIEWLHTYETGWDDKDSPFIDLKGHATNSINEQAINLWSLQEMIYLSRIQGEMALPWQQEFSAALRAVREKLWDPETQRYWDLDANTGKLWTQGENLDAYYLLYFETETSRIDAMLQRLHNPLKFDGPLLPTLAFDTPKWGGYWRGPAWPRIFCYVALALSRSGHAKEGFTWLARAINSNLGPLLPEHVDPKIYPPREHALGTVRIMGYNALDTLVLGDIAGLRTWAGQDLTVVADPALGKLYVRGQKWMGDSYDAIFEPGHPTQIWRNGDFLAALAHDQVWLARKEGKEVTFTPKQGG